MTRECQVPFGERLQGKLLRPTHHHGLKAHLGTDAELGVTHTLVTAPANSATLDKNATSLKVVEVSSR